LRRNLTRRSLALTAGLIAMCLMTSAASAGMVSDYYLTSYSPDSRIYVVNNGVVVNSAAMAYGTGEMAIAVDNDVRTMGIVTGDAGGQYTLGLTPTGTPYANPGTGLLPNQTDDGTTDGTSNYSINYATGDVLRFNRDWTGPSVLFNLVTHNDWIGITYDPTNNSLWVAEYGVGSTVANYTLGGTLLTSFTTGVTQGNLALALDHADNTLWLTGPQFSGTFLQFSKAGILLDTVTVPSLGGLNITGGEFALRSVPEPSSLALAGLGGLALFVGRKRLRRA
jgi:hypothetical protein